MKKRKSEEEEADRHRSYEYLLTAFQAAGGHGRRLPLRLTARLLYDSQTRRSWLVFFIGRQRLHKISNLRSFLREYDRTRQLLVGKGNRVVPTELASGSSRELWKLLRDFDQSGREQHRFCGRGIGQSEDCFPLPAALLQLFFQSMGEEAFAAEVDGEERQLHVEAGRPSISLQILEQDGDGCLPLPPEELIVLDTAAQYILQGNVVYAVDEAFQKMFLPLWSAWQDKKEIFIPYEDMASFFTVIRPQLERVVPVDTAPGFAEYFEAWPLQAAVYFDYYKKGLSVRLEYSYGEYGFNPLTETPPASLGTALDSRQLLRDIPGEQRIRQLLEQYGFQPAKGWLVQPGEEESFNFLSEGLPQLVPLASVYYAEGFRSRPLQSVQAIQAGISVQDERVLSVRLQTEELSYGELIEILLAYRLRKKYYRLQDGTFISLGGRQLELLAEFVDEAGGEAVVQREGLSVPLANIPYLQQRCEEMEKPGIFHVDFEESARRVLRDICHSQREPEIPAATAGILRSYQQEGVRWLASLAHYGLGGILADDMGLGKTLETIAFLASRKETDLPSLIVVPASVLYNWQEEFQRFAPDLRVGLVHGNREGRRSMLATKQGVDVLITTYQLLLRDIEAYEKWTFDCVVLDEAQYVKNSLAKVSQAVRRLHGGSRFALTGTPLENNLRELWSIFDFILPGYLDSYTWFRYHFESKVVQEHDPAASNDLRCRIRPFILRRLKREVLTELPDKTERQMVVEMTEKQSRVYKAYFAQSQKAFVEALAAHGFEEKRMEIFALLTRLRQLACDPTLFLENYTGGSGKLKALEELLPAAVAGHHRILLFSQFTSMLQRIACCLAEWDIPYYYLDGNTTSRERQRLSKHFNEGSTPVFLISLKAGGTGLNLTGADMVIHFDPWWNPAVETQAEDRAYRLGQVKNVQVVSLVSKGTIEEQIYRLQESKRSLIDQMIVSGGSFLNGLSRQEIYGLFQTE